MLRVNIWYLRELANGKTFMMQTHFWSFVLECPYIFNLKSISYKSKKKDYLCWQDQLGEKKPKNRIISQAKGPWKGDKVQMGGGV